MKSWVEFSAEVENEMSLSLPSYSVNEGMARSAVAAFCAKERKCNARRDLQKEKNGQKRGELFAKEKCRDAKDRQAHGQGETIGCAEQTILLALIVLECAVHRCAAKTEGGCREQQPLVGEIERVSAVRSRAEPGGEEGKEYKSGGLADRRRERIEKGGRGGARQPCFVFLHEKPLGAFDPLSLVGAFFHIISRVFKYYCRKKRKQMRFYAKNRRMAFHASVFGCYSAEMR